MVTGHENKRARIEIVPLIDIVFLLLVFFIYAMLSMTVYRGVRVELPRGTGVQENTDKVVIVIAVDNTISINGIPIDFKDIVNKVKERVDAVKKNVVIAGDCRSDFGIAVELLSCLRNAGISTVSFQVSGGDS